MPEKEPFIPPADRPDLPAPPPPDRRIADLQVRDLDVLLQHALLRKSLKVEIDIHKHWKIEKIEKLEKWEHPKWEKIEKWEHPKWEHLKWEIPEPKGGFEPPIPDPGPLVDPRIDQLISAVTDLRKEVEALKTRIK
jgi:hypothetical protein